MGFFSGLVDGLFGKKYCSVCGEKIAFLGNRKLTDGNLCKNCAQKLSPRFSERRESTLEQIKEQLAYREANKKRLASFSADRVFGADDEKLYIDDKMKAFVVTSESLTAGNPDIVNLADVLGCTYEINESKDEVEYKAADGRTCSYNPPQYTMEYRFYVTIAVKHPYFKEIEFRVDSSAVTIEPLFSVINDPNTAKRGSDEKSSLVSPSVNCVKVDPSINPDYRRYVAMAEEIKKVILEAKENAVKSAAAPAAVKCPHCGATTMPDANGRCEFCQGPIK